MIERISHKQHITSNDFYDPKKQRIEWLGNLPHIEQPQKIYFVTFRLADSLPAAYGNQLRYFEQEYIKNNPRPWTAEQSLHYKRTYADALDNFLNKGRGECMLKEVAVRNALIATLREYDGERYVLYDFVVMPNHVHILIKPAHFDTLKDVMTAIKRVAAFRINQLLNRSGRLWQREHFDIIIRSKHHLDREIRYIYENPKHLPPDHYHLATSLPAE